MTTEWRWGKAGVRRDPREAEANAARLRAETNRARAVRERSLAEARRAWAAGEVVPAAITIALDAAGLEGPEVDVACGAQEPDVDRWEAGELYPTWDQLCLLADLTGCPPHFFTMSRDFIAPAATSLRFHVHPNDLPRFKQVLSFPPDVVARCVQAVLPAPVVEETTDAR